MDIKVNKLNENAVMPKNNGTSNTIMDIVAISVDIENDMYIYHTGLSFDMPEGYVMIVLPNGDDPEYCMGYRTSYLYNSVGVIDSTNKDELVVKYKNSVLDNTLKLLDEITCGIDSEYLPSPDSNYQPFEPGEIIAKVMVIPCVAINFYK